MTTQQIINVLLLHLIETTVERDTALQQLAEARQQLIDLDITAAESVPTPPT